MYLKTRRQAMQCCKALVLLLLLGAVLLVVWGGMFAAGTASAQEINVVSWRGHGLRADLSPLTLDQVQAFFIARGFDAPTARMIATRGCVWGSAMGNAETGAAALPVTVEVKKWTVAADGATQPPRIREDWTKTWEQRGVGQAARVAFHWALFPTRQTFGPSDYHWGLIAFGLEPGSAFDLTLRWRQGKVERETTVRGLRCNR